jgi:formate dehydrogenase iron-sulfur subunit
MTQQTDILKRSASMAAPPSARKTLELGKLIDVSRCIGCKACQAACMEWNDLRPSVGSFNNSYTNPPDLDDQTWCLMRFNEVQIDGSLRWLILKDGCLHCSDPGCLRACPAPGATAVSMERFGGEHWTSSFPKCSLFGFPNRYVPPCFD